MSRLITILFTIIALFASHCIGSGLPAGTPLSETILLSIDYQGAGYGTRAMCAGAEVYVYRDGSIHVEMVDRSFESLVEIAVFQMSPEDYADLAAFAAPEKIARLRVREQHDVCDGNSRCITLYRDGDNGPEALLRKGGYMPSGEAFWEMYRGLRQRLDAYGVGDAVAEWRDGLEEAE